MSNRETQAAPAPATVYVLHVHAVDYGDPEDPRVFLSREGVEAYMERRGFTPATNGWGDSLMWEGEEDGEEVSAWARKTRVRA